MKYKLTNQDGCTAGDTQWGPGISHTAIGTGQQLCMAGWIHFYDSPLLAVLLNPLHANFDNPRFGNSSQRGNNSMSGESNLGAKQGTTIREIDVPVVSLEQRARFAILCAREVYWEPSWCAWAEAWLTGADRTAVAARTASSNARLAWEGSITYVVATAIAAIEAATEAALLAGLAAIDAVEVFGIRAVTRAPEAAAAAAEAAAVAHNRMSRGPLELVTLAENACSM